MAVAALGGQAPAAPPVEFVTVPKTDAQVDGPDYDFRIGRFEIRNDQFVEFLNDALTHLDDERGHYLFFDLATGDVFINSAEVGATGEGGGGTHIFDASANGHIAYTDGQFVVDDPAFESHPVAGVSWYGAVKYCNWLTIASGIGVEHRTYVEAVNANLDAWRPVTITAADWSVRDLSADERDALLEKIGYRLPMDGGVDEANPYGEWYKVASMRRDGGGSVAFDAVYGYGRDAAPMSVDANYLGSDDPFEPGTSPVGFFDGVNQLADQAPTIDTSNGYGLYDVSGNVWEWMQDQSPSDATLRRNRGGSWQSAPASLRVAIGAQRAATSAVASTGFRVVQRVIEPLLVTPFAPMKTLGIWGGPYDVPDSERTVYKVTNVSAEALTFEVSADVAWIGIDPPAGELSAPGLADVELLISPECADELGVGLHEGLVTFNADGSTVTQRAVQLTVREPLSVTPEAGLTTAMLFGGVPDQDELLLTLQSQSLSDVLWSARWVETTADPTGVAWLTIDGLPQAEGTVFAEGSVEITVAIDVSVATDLPVGLHTADVIITDECTTEELVVTVDLTVAALFSVDPPDESLSAGLFGGPFDPPSHVFTLSTAQIDPVTWTASICSMLDGVADCDTPPDPLWLSLDVTDGTVSVGDDFEVTVTIAPPANALPDGAHSLTVRFREPLTGFVVDRVVTLDVSGLVVNPTDEASFLGPLGGPFQPDEFVYTLENLGVPELFWTAQFSLEPIDVPFAGVTWLDVSPSEGVILDPEGSAGITLSITKAAMTLPNGRYGASVTFSANGAIATRDVVLTVGAEGFAVEMVNISDQIPQVGGPNYFFRIGRFEVTNVEYARFLNDARRNQTDGRGQFLYHDTDSSSVYINDSPDGEEGVAAPSGSVSTLVYNGSLGRISYESGRVDPYVVEEGFDDHPVVGVSWYGAVKFCNWLTLVQGMSPGERVYLEGSSADAWQAVAFDPSVEEQNRNGFRLPRDGGSLSTSAANEWYKAASRGPDAADAAIFGLPYGFGRVDLTEADANFLHSGDPEDNDTTPVGFFDGINLLADGETLTRVTSNGYALSDLCGNVAEWMHDRAGVDGVTRGGHFAHPIEFAQLRNDTRELVSADATLGFIGFRIAQSLTPVELSVVQADDAVRASGVVGGPYDQEVFTLRLENPGAYSLDDLSISIDVPWLEIDGVAPQLVAADGATDLTLRLSEAASALSVSPKPPGSLVLVPGRELQVDGPAYDFWIGATEVTNDQFATFLNDARDNPLDAGGSFLYHDIDSGNVYLNDVEDGDEGTTAPSATVLYDASVGRIEFLDDQYAVEAGFGLHPVVGVSWYGAVKYCNWLTLFAGLPSDLRAYVEGVEPGDWRPITISAEDFATRPMTSAEREDLLRRTVGYRLPMDDLALGASPYNEWYKAASARTDAGNDPIFDAVYGFGRDELNGVDANFLNSGDTSQEATTRGGFFDGVQLLLDEETTTVVTDNRYGLVDASGNVAEWTQDFFASDGPTGRSTRGGSYLEASDSSQLTCLGRGELSAGDVSASTGFRVVRGTGHVATITIIDNIADVSTQRFIMLNLREPLTVTPAADYEIERTYCDEVSGGATSYTLGNDSDTEMPWAVSVEPPQSWITLTGPIEGELSGTIDGGGAATLTIDAIFNDAASDLGPGVHEANVRFLNTQTLAPQFRKVSVTINQPIVVEPAAANPPAEFSGYWEGPFETLPVFRFDLARSPDVRPACVLDYEVRTASPWITLEPMPVEGSLFGTLPPSSESLVFEAAINELANDLDVGEHVATVDFVAIDASNPAASVAIEQTLTLTVLDLIQIDQPLEPWEICCEISADVLPRQVYTLTNHHPVVPVGVTISADVDWIDLEPAVLTVLPGASVEIVATLNDGAIKPHGTYPATLSFLDALTQHTQTRDVNLRITENLSVTPVVGFDAAGRVSGIDATPLIAPSTKVYQLTNIVGQGDGDLAWRVSADSAWVQINGSASATGTLGDGETESLMVSIDSTTVPPIPTGATEAVFEATVTFEDLTNAETATRAISLTLVEPRFVVDEAVVAGDAAQPSGPTYSFTMGRFHTTNAEFVSFLNDAMAHPTEPRGAYLFFDTATGDVYVNSVMEGEAGEDPGTRTILLFAPAVGGRIEFSGGIFGLIFGEEDYADHPVTGVSWYGAIKYCNWLTLDQGMLPSQRCYSEATDDNPAGWRPATLSDEEWAIGDLAQSQRATLVADYRGYRLPMDDAYDNSMASIDSADTYNEWYKAGAWNDPLRRNMTYAFGRDVLTEADANYQCSGDGFELPGDCMIGGTTPVGYYDGTIKAGSVITRPNENGFGIFDLTGNVHHWLQGHYAPPNDIDRRTIRGGSWDDPSTAASLRLDARPLFAPPSLTSGKIGFRVLKTVAVATGDFDGDGDRDLVDLQELTQCQSGPDAVAAVGCDSFDFDFDGDVDLRDVAAFQRVFTASFP